MLQNEIKIANSENRRYKNMTYLVIFVWFFFLLHTGNYYTLTMCAPTWSVHEFMSVVNQNIYEAI